MSGDTLAVIAVALAAGWASGVNVYAAVLVLGLAQRLGFVTLPTDLQVLASAWVLATASLLFALNFLADKIPLIDSLNDVLHTVVRIPPGPCWRSGHRQPRAGGRNGRCVAWRDSRGRHTCRQDRHAGADQHLARAV